ncbi:MAG: ATP-binding protein, partial [Thermodesulfobacteriota bacterium]
ARQSATPEEKNAMVPAVISKIVMKLISKTLEERYQSGYGVMADFQECARQFEESGTIRDVIPGRQDRPIGFHMPDTLMGREAEIDMLRAAFDRTCDGANEMFLVSGAAGIGKSSLIRELRKSLGAGQAHFIEGKAEQYKPNIPYYPIIQAFTDLANQILCESDVRVAACKREILATFGDNAALLTQLIPQFEHIIGKHHAVAPLNPEESSIRFQLVFREFVKSCASVVHPLVMFIDDLQWADPASLDFLAMLAGEPDIGFLLIIGAYHDNDMSASRPLMQSLAEIEQKGATIQSISLPPLTPDHVNRLIARVLYCNPADTRALSEIIFKKSQGNPFYILQFLKILYEDKILSLDPESGFSWSLAKVADMRVSDNAVDFMALKISRLPDDTRHTMRVCACFGNRFELLVVAACHGKTVNDVVADLSPAREEGLVVFSGDTGVFCHDRIKEAVYRLFSEDDRKQTHYAIGRYLLENMAEEAPCENAADIVNHLNIANEWVSSAEEQIQTARLNAQAGESALASGAFEAAFHYFQTGIQFLEKGSAIWKPTSIWDSHYELALSLHTGCANAAYLTLAYEEMERLAGEVLEHARCVNDEVKVHIVRLHSLMAQNRLDEVIEYGLAILNALGAAFPRKPSKGRILLEMVKTRLAVRGKTTKHFLNLPALTDPTVQAQVDIMATIMSTAYWNAPNLLPIIIFRLVRTFLLHGNCGFSPYVYAGYGFILCTLGRINKGYRFGQMALSLLSKINAPQYRARTLMVVNTFVRHWKEHAASEAEPLMDAVNSGMAHGDIEFAGHAMMVHGYTRFLLGAPLGVLGDELENNRNSLRRHGQLSNLHVAGIYHQIVFNAKGVSDDPRSLIGNAYDETVMETLHEEASDRTSLMHLYFAKLMLNVLFENSVEACRYARKIMIYIDGGAGSLIYPTAYFFDALAHLGCFEEAGSREKRKILLRVSKIQKRLGQWSTFAPENFLHKRHLVEAETARIKNKDKEAIALYKKAVEGALANGYLQEGALAAECLGRFYHLRGIADFAASFLARARALYLKWGAYAKVKQLEETYGGLLEAPAGKTTAFSPSAPAPDAAPAAGEDRLDMSAIVKMSHAISSEIQLEKLLVTLMRVIIENAGAEKAFLILNRNDRFVIEARADINSGDIRAMPSVPIEDFTELCARVVSYVRRTQESLVLDDAQQSSRFSGDPYINRNQVRSVLCMPLIRQQHLTGVIYLENNLTPHAFTPVRLEMITLLSTQAANCLENAISFEATRAAEKRAQKQREEYQKLI